MSGFTWQPEFRPSSSYVTVIDCWCVPIDSINLEDYLVFMYFSRCFFFYFCVLVYMLFKLLKLFLTNFQVGNLHSVCVWYFPANGCFPFFLRLMVWLWFKNRLILKKIICSTSDVPMLNNVDEAMDSDGVRSFLCVHSAYVSTSAGNACLVCSSWHLLFV